MKGEVIPVLLHGISKGEKDLERFDWLTVFSAPD
jgi:hypothetical protein